MADWLKANPAFTMEDYLWHLSVPFTKIMAADATYTKYLSEKQAKKHKQENNAQHIDNPMDLLADTGIPVFNF